MSTINRRDFLKLSSIGAVAALVPSWVGKASALKMEIEGGYIVRAQIAAASMSLPISGELIEHHNSRCVVDYFAEGMARQSALILDNLCLQDPIQPEETP